MFLPYGPRFCLNASPQISVFALRTSILLECLSSNQCFRRPDHDFPWMPQLKSMFSHPGPRFCLDALAKINVFASTTLSLLECLRTRFFMFSCIRTLCVVAVAVAVAFAFAVAFAVAL